MVFAGMLPWTLFSAILGDASTSVIGNANLISKVFFPRLIVPMATVLVALIDFAISLTILVGLMIWYGFVPGWQILLLPVFVALAVLASLGPALWATALDREVPRLPLRHSLRRSRSASMSRRSASRARSCPSSGGCSTASIPWSASSTASAGAILGGDSPIYWPGFLISLGVIASVLWVGIIWLPAHRARLRGPRLMSRHRHPRRESRQEIHHRPSRRARHACSAKR